MRRYLLCTGEDKETVKKERGGGKKKGREGGRGGKEEEGGREGRREERGENVCSTLRHTT